MSQRTTDLVQLAREAADFDSDEQAERVVLATLAELGENVSPGEARALAQALPAAQAEALESGTRQDNTPETVREFLDRVAAEADIDRAAVLPKVRSVMAALAEVAGEDELANARDQLPPEYGRIFQVGRPPVTESFVEELELHAAFESDEEARRAARAVLRTLGRRLSRGEASDIGAYLRGDAADWIVPAGSEAAEPFGTRVFVSRVADEAGVDEYTAERYIAAVAETLRDVVPTDELERAGTQLPAEFGAVVDLPGLEL